MLKSILKEMRIYQWIKNTFVLIPLVFDRQLFLIEPLTRTIIGFFLFCLVSSSVYLINDILDVEADRKHPKKKARPIASGDLPIPIAIGSAVFLILVSITGAYFLSKPFLFILIVYFLINLAYSMRLKHVPLLDVIIIAAGFVLRVAAGVSIIQVERFSPWLYVVTTVLALFFGLGKRRGELATVQQNNNEQRKVLDGYTIPLLDQLITIISATTIISYSLYTFSAPNLPDNHAMMLTIPFAIYGIFRYLYLIQVKKEGGAPDELVLSDRPLQITFLLFAASVVIIFYLF
ncbi:MAG: decaprenyl-phosphate phosphoribosyltransferase [Anaerolineaceae bacterium]|jgi:4-hydroxybenzoate polyprenyltransferase|nr:decaprenyl-phosphate phosphoribosyltransferase [Anaerolineaceae bacterium]